MKMLTELDRDDDNAVKRDKEMLFLKYDKFRMA